jgi:hypothetical protein
MLRDRENDFGIEAAHTSSMFAAIFDSSMQICDRYGFTPPQAETEWQLPAK